MSQMKEDFIVIQLLPRCWACEKYILTRQRYVCKRSRERGDKKYVLCEECFGSIPNDFKTVVGKEHLVNSCSLSADKKTILEWPVKKLKSKAAAIAASKRKDDTSSSDKKDGGKSTDDK